MMDRARLGSVPGAAAVWVRRGREGFEHRGSFWFRAEQEDEVRRLLAAGAPVELVGWIEGSWKHLTTRLVSADPSTGLGVFEGPGEPTRAEDLRRDTAG
jgi:hypothetical protein